MKFFKDIGEIFFFYAGPVSDTETSTPRFTSRATTVTRLPRGELHRISEKIP